MAARIQAAATPRIDDAAAAAAPTVTLTFDDGPHSVRTPRLLRVLARQNVRAGFFVLGRRLNEAGVTTMRSAFADGHQIGNHSFSHADLTQLPEPSIEDELDRTQALIGACAGPRHLFRPPFGTINDRVIEVARRRGYIRVPWDVDTLDWKILGPGWVDWALDRIRADRRAIVLMHDVHDTTVDHVETFIMALRQRFPAVRFAPLA